MAKLKITIDDERVKEKLLCLKSVGENFRKPLEEAGLRIMRIIDRRFKSETDPDGNKWKPLAESTKKRRRKGRGKGEPKILKDRGILRSSVTQKGAKGNIFRSFNTSVEVGTNLVYANLHQFGHNFKVPQRKGSVYLRLDKRKHRQGYFIKGFSKKSHKNAVEFGVTRKSHEIKIPKRPFLGLNNKDKEGIIKIITKSADKMLKKITK